MAIGEDPASQTAGALLSKRTLLKAAAWPGIASMGLSGCASTMSSNDSGPGITRETFTIPSEDPSIGLHVRNKRPTREHSFPSSKIVLMIHGGTYPAETVYDLPLPGGSWLDYMAGRGFDAYLVDVRGYGRSTRPAAMSRPASAGMPFADAADGVKDVEAVIDFILTRRRASKLNLLGWSWGLYSVSCGRRQASRSNLCRRSSARASGLAATQGACRIASTWIFSRTVSATKGRLCRMPKALRLNSASKSPPHTSRRSSGLV